MAIVIERTITVKNDTATLDNPLYLYVGDGDIIYLFTIKEKKKAAFFGHFDDQSNQYDLTSDKSYGEVRIYKPDEELVFTTRAEIIDDKLQAKFTYDNIDQLTEAGLHKLQIHLYDDDDSEQNRFTIPPIDLHVLLPVGIDTASVGEAKADYAMIRIIDDPIDSFLDDGSYNRKEWANGDIISSGQLNKMEEAIYQINANSDNFVTEEELSYKADTSHKHSEYITEEEFTTELSYKANRTHKHSEYATEEYVDEAIENAQLSGDGSSVDLSDYALKTDIPTVPTNVSAFNNDKGYMTSTTITRIEVVDTLPAIEENGVLYIVKGE